MQRILDKNTTNKVNTWIKGEIKKKVKMSKNIIKFNI